MNIYIYILACASVTIYNIIYVFNINFRKLDGQYRSWIEYLNERYEVCILGRSIKLDTDDYVVLVLWWITFGQTQLIYSLQFITLYIVQYALEYT